MSELKIVEDKLMTVKEVAGYLSIKESTIYNMTMRETIPHFHIGRLLRFKRDAIDKWLLDAQGINNR